MRLLRKIILLLVFILIIPFCYAQNCIDPDGGQNYYQKSCVTFYGIENYYCDRCINSNILLEAYCEGDNLIFKKYDCPLNSCVDGTCTSTTTTSTTTTTRTTTTTTTTTSTTTTTISTTTITVEECYLNNVNIDTFHCSGAEGTCCAGDRIDVTAYYSGSCPLSAYLQLDIADNELNYDGSGCEVYDSSPIVDQFCNGLADIDGLGFVVTCSGGTCIGSTQLPSGTYAVPVPDCRGVRIDTGGAGLYKDGFPCQEDNPVSNYAWTNSISGSISFGIDLQCGAILTTTTTTIMTTTTRTTTTTSSTTTTVLLAPPTSTTARTSTTIQTTTTTSTTTTTNPTISKTGDIALSCEVSPNHSCSEKKDSYPGFPDIEEMDFSIPDSANCEDNIEVTVEWAGWHGYKDDNIDECTPNYWAVFLETSTGSYSLLGSCQSFNESDCVLWDPNTYTMSFDVKMPNKDSIVDGTYNIFVTGETDSGYCNPDESNVDIKLSKPINLMNCGSVSSSTTTTSTATTTLGSTNTTIITTIPISGFTTSTTTITHSTCTGTNIYACYETDQERCELKACCYWSNGKCGRLPCDQLSESECSKCTGCQSESEGSKTTTTISEPPLKSTTTTESGTNGGGGGGGGGVGGERAALQQGPAGGAREAGEGRRGQEAGRAHEAR
ncbi:MAG: hypothetical protein NTW30_00865, partial [Candidatus Aenigmarchaeota archaeon]|nr:hypothetical protein [Candidatus Aenigmarchaeota archaeon]